MIDGEQKISDWVRYLNQRGTCYFVEYGSDDSGMTMKIDKWLVDAALVREVSCIVEGLMEERCRRC